MARFFVRAAFLIVFALLTHNATAQVTIINDNFNIDTSANYTVVNGGVSGGGDGHLLWAYDYGTLGIPAAPGTTDGSTIGVRMSVNETANNGGTDETEAYTIYNNTSIVGVMDYTVTVDVWLGVWSPGDTGSTQSATIGTAGDGVTRNHFFEATSTGTVLTGNGNFMVFSSDGGDSSDYRHWQNGGPINNFDPTYLAPDRPAMCTLPGGICGGGTNVIGANFIGFFEEISNFNAPIPGVIGNNWATLKVEVLGSEGKLKYYARGGLPETTGDPGIVPPNPPEFLQIVEAPLTNADGLVSFGLSDMYSSIATVVADQFGIFDNLFVEGTASTIDGDFNDDTFWDCADIDALSAAVAAMGNDPSFDLNGDMLVNTADIAAWLVEGGAMNPAQTGGNPFLPGDATLDGVVDGQDFIAWNGNKFTNDTDWCGGNFNGDLVIDGQDFITWNQNKFMSSDSSSVVPEPTSLWLFGSFALAALLRRRAA